MKSKGKLTPADAPSSDEIAREIAKCDAAFGNSSGGEKKTVSSLLQAVASTKADAGCVVLAAHDCRVIAGNQRGQDCGFVVVGRRNGSRLNFSLSWVRDPPAFVADDAAIAVMQLKSCGLQGSLIRME